MNRLSFEEYSQEVLRRSLLLAAQDPSVPPSETVIQRIRSKLPNSTSPISQSESDSTPSANSTAENHISPEIQSPVTINSRTAVPEEPQLPSPTDIIDDSMPLLEEEKLMMEEDELKFEKTLSFKDDEKTSIVSDSGSAFSLNTSMNSGAFEIKLNESSMLPWSKKLEKAFLNADSRLRAAEWDERCRIMKSIQDLATISNSNSERKQFLDQLRRLREAIDIQLSDRRSSVTKQVCEMLTSCAQHLKQDFVDEVIAHLPALFRGVSVGVKVISMHCGKCCTDIVEAEPSPRLLSLIIGTYKESSHAEVRSKAVELCASIIRSLVKADITMESLNGIVHLCINSIQDSDAGVRKIALTLLYPEISSKFPDKAELILQELPPSGKRAIQRLKSPQRVTSKFSRTPLPRRAPINSASPTRGDMSASRSRLY